MVDLRFIQHLFIAWTTKSQDEGCFLEEAEKRNATVCEDRSKK